MENANVCIQEISPDSREQVSRFLQEHWFSTDMVVTGRIMDMRVLPGFIAWEKGEIVGLITYAIEEETCEIFSLDSLIENRGLGTTLVQHVAAVARGAKCKKVKVVTTNDNTHALHFYQKRGFDLVRIHRNELERSRILKPSIPLLGNDGIPLRHEIELEMLLE